MTLVVGKRGANKELPEDKPQKKRRIDESLKVYCVSNENIGHNIKISEINLEKECQREAKILTDSGKAEEAAIAKNAKDGKDTACNDAEGVKKCNKEETEEVGSKKKENEELSETGEEEDPTKVVEKI